MRPFFFCLFSLLLRTNFRASPFSKGAERRTIEGQKGIFMREQASPRDHFAGWLFLLFFLDILYGASFLALVYFFSESLFNGNRWWEFSLLTGLAILCFAGLSLVNKKMSFGELGSDMQKMRTSRFSVAFVSLACACLLGALFLFLLEGVFFPKTIGHPFGALAALLDCLAGVVLFFQVYFLLEGRGVSRL